MKMKYLLLLSFVIFAILSCEKDPCEGVDCQNDGFCTNGECVCPDRYTGEDCSEEIPPSRVRVHQVSLTSFPVTKEDGSNWDMDSAADIYPAIYDENGQELWSSSAVFQDADGSQDYMFEISPVLDLDNPEQTYIIRLMDFDSSPPDELMGEIFFTPYMVDEGFPSMIAIDNGAELSFILEVEYF